MSLLSLKVFVHIQVWVFQVRSRREAFIGKCPIVALSIGESGRRLERDFHLRTSYRLKTKQVGVAQVRLPCSGLLSDASLSSSSRSLPLLFDSNQNCEYHQSQYPGFMLTLFSVVTTKTITFHRKLSVSNLPVALRRTPPQVANTTW